MANPTTKPESKLPAVFAGRSNMSQAEHAVGRWYYIVDGDISYERLLEPDFWGKMFAREMHLHDTIDAYDSAGTYGARLLVTGIDASRGHVSVVERHPKLSMKPAVSEPFVSGDMVASYEGPIKKWVVKRQADNVVLADRIVTRDEAKYQMTAVIPMRVAS